MCPSYLDGDHALTAEPGKELGQARGDTRLLAWLCSFQGPRRGARLTVGVRSLKTQQHATPRGGRQVRSTFR
jgi:hypothetical protein